MTEIYLDSNTCARPSNAAIDAMQPFLTERWGTPSAPHLRGQDLLPAINDAYNAIYQLFGVDPADYRFHFTDSGAEAVNQVIHSVYFDITRESGRNHYITSCNDEAPAILAISRLEQMGCASSMAPVEKDGTVTAQGIAETLTPRTALVSLSWVNALTGVIQPLEEIAEVCRERGVLLHIDATHAAGRMFFDLDDIKPDFVTFHGEQIHAPTGSGGLLVRARRKINPLIMGRPENVPALMALAAAARQMLLHRDHIGMEVARLRTHLETRLCRDLPGTYVCHADSPRIPTTTALVFPGAAADALLFLLDRSGVRANFGGGQVQRLALQLEVAGFAPHEAQCALSFALSRQTSAESIDDAADRIGERVRQLQKASHKLWEEHAKT